MISPRALVWKTQRLQDSLRNSLGKTETQPARFAGGGIPMHGSGGADGTTKQQPSMKAQYRFANNTFMSGQINMALALSDIGPGDGATMLLPGSHKANVPRPAEMRPSDPGTMEGVEGAIEVHLKKGDVLLFTDGVMHGGARKTTPGVRRTIWYRYTMAWLGKRLSLFLFSE